MDNKETECPCIDCITLGICKAAVFESSYVWHNLSFKCSIFKEFYQEAKISSEKWKLLLKVIRGRSKNGN